MRCLRFAVGLVALLGVVPSTADAAPVASRFRDGGREVVAERTGEITLDRRGRRLARVRLTYEDGRSAEAAVDETAIARLEPGADPAALEAAGLRVVRPLAPTVGLWLVEDAFGGDGLDAANRLARDDARPERLREVTPNLHLRTRAMADPYTPTDPRYGGQWYFQNLGMPDAWGITQGSAETTIVVIDTGCDYAHPDLVDKLDPGLDVVDQDDDASYEPSDSGAAHGTECAGLVGAATDNDEGIAGGCPACRVRCVRMLSDAPTPISADVDAFQFALDVDADVVSNSWGFTESIPVPSALAAIIEEVSTNGRSGKGALVLFAAGNDDRDIEDDELQAAPGVLCIGAINNFDESTPFTNRGPALDLVAPTGTLTTDISGAAGDDPSDYTSLFGGTSSACPVAAGVAGLLVSAAPEKTAAELSAILVETSRPAPFAVPDAAGHDAIYGYGIIDPAAALNAALGLGGAGGGGPGGGDGGDDEMAGDDIDEGGCGCSVPGRSSRGALAAGALALAVIARRRRR